METFKAQLTLVIIVIVVLLVLYVLYSVIAKSGEYDSWIAGASSWVSSIVQVPRGSKAPQKKPLPTKPVVKQGAKTRPVQGNVPGATPRHAVPSATALYCDWELQELDVSDLDKVIDRMDVPFAGNKKGVMIGVADDCEIPLDKSNHRYVSHYHAVLFHNSRGVFVKDNGSSNGMFDEDMEAARMLNVGNQEIFYLSPGHAFRLVNKGFS